MLINFDSNWYTFDQERNHHTSTDLLVIILNEKEEISPTKQDGFKIY